MKRLRRLFGRKSSGDIETREVTDPGADESGRRVLEVALYWRGELLRVEHHRMILVACGADFGVPDELEGARAALVLPEQMRESTWTHFGDLSLRLTLTFAGLAPGRLNASDRDAWGTSAFSALLHVLAMASLAWVFVASGGAADEDIARDRLGEMRALLAAADARAAENVASEGESNAATARDDSVVAQAAAPRDQGAAGSARAHTPPHAVAGSTDDTARESREDTVRVAASFGLLGLLPTAMTRGPDGVFSRDASPGAGNMWGDEIGDSFGIGGIGLTGIGEGGGGRGEGISVGAIGSIGTCGCGGYEGIGRSSSLQGGRGGHVVGAPSLRCGSADPVSKGPCAATVTGRLPPEVIQRIVRQSEGRFRLCYEQGLAKNPSLAGRVTVKFVIGRDGAVSVAQDAGSDLPDAAVVSCMVRAVGGLSFPQPEGGIVTVVYPWVLAPTS